MILGLQKHVKRKNQTKFCSLPLSKQFSKVEKAVILQEFGAELNRQHPKKWQHALKMHFLCSYYFIFAAKYVFLCENKKRRVVSGGPAYSSFFLCILRQFKTL